MTLHYCLYLVVGLLFSCQAVQENQDDDDELFIAPQVKSVQKPKIDSDFGVMQRPRIQKTGTAESEQNEPQSDADELGEITKVKLYVIAEFLHVRKRPDRFSPTVGYKRGGEVVYVSIVGDWSKLEYNKWIRTRWLSSGLPEHESR